MRKMWMRLMARYSVADITTPVVIEETMSLTNTKTTIIIIIVIISIEIIIVTITIVESIVITIKKNAITTYS